MPCHPIPSQQSLVLNPWGHDAERPVSVTSEGSQYEGEETAPSQMGRQSRCPQELLVWQRKHCIKSNRCVQLQLK